MKLFNLKNRSERVDFAQAMRQCAGTEQGLFFPSRLPKLSYSQIRTLLRKDFVRRSACVLSSYLESEFSSTWIEQCVKESFDFRVPLILVEENILALELFHGPTLSFKDFGARLLANMLMKIVGRQKITVLTATSGDTGAAAAHAFYKHPNVRVVVLYPRKKIDLLQKKFFSTLGRNVAALSIDGSFDDCQALVKQSFDDVELRTSLHLISANSINVCRLLAQICYYFEAVSQLPSSVFGNVVVSVPSGNFGNLTAGLLAKSLGLPIKRFLASTNRNDTVPRFLKTRRWLPHPTTSTLSNAMDVSRPSNWVRIEEIFATRRWPMDALVCESVDDCSTRTAMRRAHAMGYALEPHSATAYLLLKKRLKSDEVGMFLCTAHPAKMNRTMERVLKNPRIVVPRRAMRRFAEPSVSHRFPSNFRRLKRFLLSS